jgi:hypothetical protein
MMMLPDKKKMVSVIMEKMKPEMPKMEIEIEGEQPQSDYQLAKEDAAKKMIEALDKKDAKMLALYLQDFLDMCESCSEESED